MRILVLNGPNLNLLGSREPQTYGCQSYAELVQTIQAYALSAQVEVDIFQSNSEGSLIDAIQKAEGSYDGIILNPAAYTHYSYALFDAIQAVNIPVIEVHLSNIMAREPFRSHSVTAPACVGQITGLGFTGYLLAIQYFISSSKRG